MEGHAVESGGMRALLERATLDDTFRALLSDDPHAAMEGYSLDERERDALAQGGAALLRYVIPTVEDFASSHPPRATADPAAGFVTTSLPEVRLLLRVAPQPRIAPDGSLTFLHIASLSPLEGGGPVEGEPAPSAPRIPVQARSNATWRHETDTEASRDAARAVLQAAPSDRRARLLDLIRALAGE